MKRKILSISLLALLGAAASAQTMNVVVGNVTYQFPAATVGDITYGNSGTTLTAMGKTFTLSEVDQMFVDDSEVTKNSVAVTWSDTGAKVVVSGDIAQYMTIGAATPHVWLIQSDDVTSEITYTLSGSSQNGSLWMDGELKSTFVLNGLTLHNPDSAAINIRDGKRIAIQVAKDTENNLSDGTGGSHKGALAVKGHAEFSGKGTLNITGNTKHAYWGGEYVQLKASFGTLNVLGAQGDGFNVNQYFQMNGGTVTVNGVADDGIQVSYDTDDDGNIDVDDENTGQFLMQGGTLTVSTTADAAKAVKCEGDLIINSSKSVPTLTLTTSGGGVWDSDENDTKASSCLSTDANLLISDGVISCTSTGAGGKGIKADGTLTISGGEVTVSATGSTYTYGSSGGSGGGNRPGGGGGWPGGGGGWPGGNDDSDSDTSSSPKGIKSDGNMYLTGGTINVTSTNSEAIESKAELYIQNDVAITATAGDDVINSSSHMYIQGGTVSAVSTGNDGIDANGNLYVSGGHTVAFGSRQPECGIDANSEDGYKVYFTGGELFAIGGGRNSAPSNSSSTQPYVTASSCTVSSGNTVTLKSGNTTLATFTMPAGFSSGQVICTAPGLTSGSSYTLTLGNTTKTVTATQYSSSGGWGW